MKKQLLIAAASLVLAFPASAQEGEPQGAPSPNQIVNSAAPEEWVRIAPEDLLIMTLAPDAEGNERHVFIQLMPAPFSQGWVGNIRAFARSGWYDNISVNRVQDNYVVQWGDPNYDNPEAEGEAKALPDGLQVMQDGDYVASGDVPGWKNFKDLTLPRGDYVTGYTAFEQGWPVQVQGTPDSSVKWPVHCYGMVGVGRSYSPDTGSGAELYTVIGHAPRHLDRNIALVGRIVKGMEHLSSLPRGKGTLGFYEDVSKRTPIQTVRVAGDLMEFPIPIFEYLASDSDTFLRYAAARANRRDPFFNVPAGGTDICNIPTPIRQVPTD